MRYLKNKTIALAVCLSMALSLFSILKVHSKAPTPAFNTVSAIGVNSTVDATTAGNTYTISATETVEFHPVLLRVETVTSSNVIVPAIISVGTNSPDYNNIATGIVTPLTAGTTRTVVLDTSFPFLPTSSYIKAKVTTAATGVSPTQTVKVTMWSEMY